MTSRAMGSRPFIYFLASTHTAQTAQLAHRSSPKYDTLDHAGTGLIVPDRTSSRCPSPLDAGPVSWRNYAAFTLVTMNHVQSPYGSRSDTSQQTSSKPAIHLITHSTTPLIPFRTRIKTCLSGEFYPPRHPDPIPFATNPSLRPSGTFFPFSVKSESTTRRVRARFLLARYAQRGPR